MEEYELRRILECIITNKDVSDDCREEAVSEIHTIIEEAREHGFNEADAVKAILSPVFSTRQSCNCPSCRVRRLTAA